LETIKKRKVKGNYTKVGLNIGDDLLAKIDSYADSLSINRSSAICVLVSQSLEYKDMLIAMNNLPELMEKPKDK